MKTIGTCKRGHPFDEVNPYIDGKGIRRCHECADISRQKYSKRLATAQPDLDGMYSDLANRVNRA